jgi:8-hydroxy-5-deazaflavin:NADPH oxidoreductase
MKIAIVGAGKVGTALGKQFVRTGHSVTYASRSLETSRKAAEAVGAAAAANMGEATKDADIVVLAIPYLAAARDVATALAPIVAGKIVIDVCNPTGPDGMLATKGISAAEEFAEWMPGARVVKAFNTIFSRVQADPQAHGVELDVLFATDDQAARAVMVEVVKSFGFRPVYAGPLIRARELEELALLNIRMQATLGGDWRSSFVLIGAPNAALEPPILETAANREG